MKRAGLIIALALALGSVAADCSQCNTIVQARRGNVDRVADAVLVTGSDHHTYMVTSNPEIQHLRMLDLTAALFVESPNRFFPASVPVGAETRRLAVAPGDDTRVFALDASDDKIFVVRTVTTEKPGVDWTVQGKPIATDRAPGDLAAFKNTDGSLQFFVSIPADHRLQVLTQPPPAPNQVDLGAQSVLIDLGVDSAPGDVVVDPFGDAVLVGDSVLNVVHVIDRATLTLVRDLDVGGPTGHLSVGVVNLPDGQAPVALALRTDANIAVALRLFRPGFREDRYAVLGSAETSAYPLVGYVPDERTSATVCCNELTVEAVNAGEASDAWAAVGMANGRVLYLRLAALAAPDRALVRPFDNDLATTALSSATLPGWAPVPPDDDTRQPVPTVTAHDTFGDPPFVGLPDPNAVVSLIWEGPPPGLASLSGTFASGVFSADANVAGRGARVGDVAVLNVESPRPGCSAPEISGAVTAVSGHDVTVALGVGIEASCVAGAGAVALTVNAGNAFVAFDNNGNFLGRLNFDSASPDGSVVLPGALLTLAASAAGPPLARGSTLAVPIDPHVEIVDLDLSDAVTGLGTTGFGSAGFLPIAITGGEMLIPAPTQGAAPIVARRMQIGTASQDNTGLNVLFSCDEAESTAGFCDSFR